MASSESLPPSTEEPWLCGFREDFVFASPQWVLPTRRDPSPSSPTLRALARVLNRTALRSPTDPPALPMCYRLFAGWNEFSFPTISIACSFLAAPVLSTPNFSVSPEHGLFIEQGGMALVWKRVDLDRIEGRCSSL